MRSSKCTAMAVRLPSGLIDVEEVEGAMKQSVVRKIPIVRGVVSFVKSMITGFRCLMRSADKSEMITESPADDAAPSQTIVLTEEAAFPAQQPQEQEQNAPQETETTPFQGERRGTTAIQKPASKQENTGFAMYIAAVVGVLLAILLFTVLPVLAIGGIELLVPLGGWKTVIEGIIKIAILLLYMWGISKMKDIKRLYQYHGAEHKSIACLEAGEELTVANARRFSKHHPRCGTSFLLIVVLLSILVTSVVTWENLALRICIKLLLLPVVAGLAYEVIQLAGRYDNILTRIVSAPGLWLQRFTTFEPDDSQLEVALCALKAVLPDDLEKDRW